MSVVAIHLALDRLPRTEETIAAHLEHAGIRGRRREPLCCPIAEYLLRQVPGYTFYARPGIISAIGESAGPRHTVYPPPAVANFMRFFDNGAYPQLELP
jgi:hypothetical protein